VGVAQTSEVDRLEVPDGGIVDYHILAGHGYRGPVQGRLDACVWTEEVV